MKRCARCGEVKPTSEFGWKDKDKKRLTSYCRACVRANSRAHYQANKPTYIAKSKTRNNNQRISRTALLFEYFASHPCADCGETDPRVLEFDHLRDKEFNIGSELRNRRWETILAEIAKCDVVCANCHRRRTAQRHGHLRVQLGDVT